MFVWDIMEHDEVVDSLTLDEIIKEEYSSVLYNSRTEFCFECNDEETIFILKYGGKYPIMSSTY